MYHACACMCVHVCLICRGCGGNDLLDGVVCLDLLAARQVRRGHERKPQRILGQRQQRRHWQAWRENASDILHRMCQRHHCSQVDLPLVRGTPLLMAARSASFGRNSVLPQCNTAASREHTLS